MEVSQSIREFKYNGVALKDPGAQFTLDQVREFYATLYPEIVNASVEGPTSVGNKVVYEFRRAVGTKGSLPERSLDRDTLLRCPIIIFGRQGTGKSQHKDELAHLFGKQRVFDEDPPDLKSLTSQVLLITNWLPRIEELPERVILISFDQAMEALQRSPRRRP